MDVVILLVALTLLLSGVYLLTRHVSAEEMARREGRAAARAYRERRDLIDAFWEGYREELYGNGNGPVLLGPALLKREKEKQL